IGLPICVTLMVFSGGALARGAGAAGLAAVALGAAGLAAFWRGALAAPSPAGFAAFFFAGFFVSSAMVLYSRASAPASRRPSTSLTLRPRRAATVRGLTERASASK